MTIALLSSVAAAGFGVAAFSHAAPALGAEASCAALDRAAHDTAANVDKLHGVAQFVSPALPHPDNPEEETGSFDVVALFFQAGDLSRSLRQSSGELRDAEPEVDFPDLRDAADNLAQVNDDTATWFDDTTSPVGTHLPLDEKARRISDKVKNAIQAFRKFNDVYSKRCGEDLMAD
ncbi:hypothetical protein [Segniliparus rugosus]|uniref:hypothetical protein n=1 Tax=Segniliparus rugosus TaxID=286804 RepID=UPI000313BCCA|nr:hypothetical protein [Segniliparus rugosus]